MTSQEDVAEDFTWILGPKHLHASFEIFKRTLTFQLWFHAIDLLEGCRDLLDRLPIAQDYKSSVTDHVPHITIARENLHF